MGKATNQREARMMAKEKKFNVKGLCIPRKHYMVDLSSRLEKMKDLIEDEEYFVINRARQYGKTTTLAALEHDLADDYTVISLNFQGFGDVSFSSEEHFCQKLLKEMKQSLRFSGVLKEKQARCTEREVDSFDSLSDHITEMCEGSKMVLMIDEVDRASNHRVFLTFLGMLRTKYQARSRDKDFTFHSVILAGVYDIKNIKLKMVQEGLHTLASGERVSDSPWNIAENFDEEMSFAPIEIAGMLADYESDHQTGMNIKEVAEAIYSYTSGYPFLVSRICQYVHEKLEKDWTQAGVLEAVRLMTEEPQPNTLFDDLFKNMRNHQKLADFLYAILMEGEVYLFSLGDEVMEQGLRYAFIRIVEGRIRIHNKIFEMIMTSYFISKEKREGKKLIKNSVEGDVVNGELFNIELFFEKFNAHYQRHYSHRDEAFIEREAAFLFLFFLQPYLNGKGAFHLESKPNLATGKRMDVIVTYGHQAFIIELKIWKGQKYQADAYEQLTTYMSKRGEEKGYLLTFDFRQKKEIKQEWIKAHGKSILEVQV